MNSNNIIFSQFISKSITALVGVFFTPATVKNGYKGSVIKTPSDFMPVLRFAVCSDIHLNGEENQAAAIRFGQMLDDLYSYAEKSDIYKKLDAVVVAGDFTGGGAEKQYTIYNKISKERIKYDTKLLTVIGNHEFIDYRDVDATVGYTVYKKHINEELDTDVVINGYHFIGVAYDDNGKTFKTKLTWLKDRLDNAVKENPEKPVFVYQHPHPFLTVYGSVNWGDTDIRKILSKYPQVVNFSGHSHYCPADPRSVWQGSFTAVGCGSLSAFMGNLNYIDGDKDAPGKSGGFWIVEVDEKGRVRMMLYDIENRRFFDNIEYYFTDLSDKAKRTYTWHKQKSFDTSPLFPENSEIGFTKNENEDIILSFPEAKGYYEAENYKITIKSKDKKTVYAKTVISEYVRAVNTDMNVNIGMLPCGEYDVSVKAFSPYAKKGELLRTKIKI